MRCIIVDDEYGSREALKALLQLYFPQVDVLAVCHNNRDAVEAIQRFRPQLVFLDVRMHHETGFDLLVGLPEIFFEVIVVTAYAEYALEAFKFSALDYLLKPIQVDDLQKAIGRAERRFRMVTLSGAPLPGERWVTSAELDDFIYATSHSLRGPLATLKGLINLLKLPGSFDKDFIVGKMAFYADRLDERLYKMIYLAESDKLLDVEDDGASLQTILDTFRQDEFVEETLLSVVVNMLEPPATVWLQHGNRMLQCLRNVRAFLLRMGAEVASVTLRVSQGDGLLAFDFAALGGALDEDKVRKIDRANVGYSEILSDPDYTEIYSAKKIISRLQGFMRTSSDQGYIHVWISIPLAR
jgi:response regulator of citrate/malate metabolism